MTIPKFKINQTRIDLGNDGSFLPGSESRLADKLSNRKDGRKIFENLVDRGALIIDAEPVEVKKAKTGGRKTAAKRTGSNETKDTGTNDPDESDAKSNPDGDDPGENDDEETSAVTYQATGRYEMHNYGGPWFHVVDPDGRVVEPVNGKGAAEARVAELNKNIESGK